jgi:hypothetical protein
MTHWLEYYSRYKDKLPLNEIVKFYNFLILKEQQEFILRQQSHRRSGSPFESSTQDSGFLLQENGDYLLQENNDRILL